MTREFDERDSILRRATAKAYIEQYQSRLGLKHWDIRYTVCNEDGDAASVTYRTAERVAQVGIDPDVPYELISTLVIHELVHLTLKPLTQLMENLIAKQKDDAFRDFLADEYNAAEEEVVESITRALGGERFIPYGELLRRWESFS